jgi:two-component system response regulator
MGFISDKLPLPMSDVPRITILIVDDSRADVRLAQLWLRNSAVIQDVQVARSGAEALAYLRQEDPFAQADKPQLILLDVHLPDMLGWDLLAELRRDAALSEIPVIVLTGTVNDVDAQLARDLGAARYLCKPFDADEFATLVREIETTIRETEG